MTPYHVDVTEEGVTIARHSRIMLFWNVTEWEEDAEVVFVIVRAVILALTNPIEMDAKLREMGKL